MMNGFDEKSHFGDEPEGNNFVKAFDAFPKAKPQYVTRTSGGGKWTVTMAIISVILVWAELSRWWKGEETHTFSVEKGVNHGMHLNIDITVKMQCKDINVNVQDASGDRILADKPLTEDPTLWSQWVDTKGVHKLGQDSYGRVDTSSGWHDEGFGNEHVHDIVALGRKTAKWARTPRLGRHARPDSCRIFGSLDLNQVQGDFHITARGHGYMEGWGAEHLDHSAFNFSHVISELSFGNYYPSLVNPLDRTVNKATANFHKFQYFMSVVPTYYTAGGSTIHANQYAVNEQSKEVGEHTFNIPGLFFKYDIEPILLIIDEHRPSFMSFVIKLVNLVSGVLVTGHWCYTLTEWAVEVLGRRRARRSGMGEGFIGAKGGAYMD